MTSSARPAEPDPHAWLEEVDSPAALEWVGTRSSASESRLGDVPGHAQRHAAIRVPLEAPDRIPLASQAGDHLYGFWTGAEHPRGAWRRSTWDPYRPEEPRWAALVHVDALAR